MRKALLLVDIQNDFLPGGSLAVPDGDKVIPVANSAIPLFEIVLASQDWHPDGHCSFASRYPGYKPGETILIDGIEHALWPDHCILGTRGAEIAPGIDLGRIHSFFRKGTEKDSDSYSAFFDNDRRKSTGLMEYLKEHGVGEITIIGLTTEYCVQFTSLDARSLGLQVKVVLDGIRGVEMNPGDCEEALDNMSSAGVEILQRL